MLDKATAVEAMGAVGATHSPSRTTGERGGAELASDTLQGGEDLGSEVCVPGALEEEENNEDEEEEDAQSSELVFVAEGGAGEWFGLFCTSKCICTEEGDSCFVVVVAAAAAATALCETPRSEERVEEEGGTLAGQTSPVTRVRATLSAAFFASSTVFVCGASEDTTGGESTGGNDRVVCTTICCDWDWGWDCDWGWDTTPPPS